MPQPEGVAARRAALKILDSVLRRGQTVDSAAQGSNLPPADAAPSPEATPAPLGPPVLPLSDDQLARWRDEIERAKAARKNEVA